MQGVVPYLGTFLTDLTMIHTAHSDLTKVHMPILEGLFEPSLLWAPSSYDNEMASSLGWAEIRVTSLYQIGHANNVYCYHTTMSKVTPLYHMSKRA